MKFTLSGPSNAHGDASQNIFSTNPRMKLHDIYASLGGQHHWRETSGWPTAPERPVGKKTKKQEIFGVTRDWRDSEAVVAIDLAWNGLQGSIAVKGIWAHASLTTLQLSSNKISGSLPGFALRNLVSIKHLHLYRNFISGTIPTEIGDLRNLKSLWLMENILEGLVSFCSTLSVHK
jgi:Leucine-rich repeat (LRR) protein